MNKLSIAIGLIMLVLGALFGYAIHGSGPSFGAATTDCQTTTCLTNGLRITSGDFSIVTTNAATSTAALGCIQTIATSTATAIKLIPGSANSAATSTNTVGSVGGFVTWQYGTCP